MDKWHVLYLHLHWVIHSNVYVIETNRTVERVQDIQYDINAVHRIESKTNHYKWINLKEFLKPQPANDIKNFWK